MPEFIHVNDVEYQPTGRGVGEESLLRRDNLTVKLLRYKKGDEVAMHRHTDEEHEKLIIQGKAEFTDNNGTKVTLGPGVLYMCGSGRTYYSGIFLEDSILMVIESSDSTIEYPTSNKEA